MKSSVGMYSTRYFNKNKVDGNAYLAVGDAYHDPLANVFRQPKKGEKLKVFATAMVPVNAENGNFTKTTYVASKYVDKTMYLDQQPIADRKNAFGSHDASRRDEFSNNIRTAQYRDNLKAENRIYKKTPEEYQKELDELRESVREQNGDMKETSRFNEKVYSYDVGRTRIPEYDIRDKKDSFYKFNMSQGKFYGSEKPVSGDYGTGAWDYNYKPPAHGPKGQIKNFYDRSHLKVGK
jgi:HD superfamily phosphohydrolase